MIVWLIIIGSLFLILTAPARIFGALCGWLAKVAVRDRKPPLPPPI